MLERSYKDDVLGFLICYNSPRQKRPNQDRRRRSREEEEIPVWELTELGSSLPVWDEEEAKRSLGRFGDRGAPRTLRR